MSYSLTHSLTLFTFFAHFSAIIASAEDERCVTFPPKHVLAESLRKAGFQHFMEKTKIENIVDDQLVPLGVAMRLEFALYDYNEYMQRDAQNEQQVNMFARMMQMSKAQILAILLQNDPVAREQLKSQGLL